MKDKRHLKNRPDNILLKEVLRLSKLNISVGAQKRKFIKICDSSHATFSRYRKMLSLQHINRSFKKAEHDYTHCYFCSNASTIIHHINKNRKDNRKENLVRLCRKCHNKIHRLYNDIIKKPRS